MRKIEYRGKRKDTEQWINGYYIKWSDYKDNISHQIVSSVGYRNDVYPETIGQLWATINDKDFFEGDIIHFEKDNIIYLIIYNDVNKCFSFVDNDEYDKIQHADELTRLNILINKGIINVGLIERKKPKIIGNIHDNPELLKK